MMILCVENDELNANAQELFEQFDENSDGILDRDEFDRVRNAIID